MPLLGDCLSFTPNMRLALAVTNRELEQQWLKQERCFFPPSIEVQTHSVWCWCDALLHHFSEAENLPSHRFMSMGSILKATLWTRGPLEFQPSCPHFIQREGEKKKEKAHSRLFYRNFYKLPFKNSACISHRPTLVTRPHQAARPAGDILFYSGSL